MNTKLVILLLTILGTYQVSAWYSSESCEIQDGCSDDLLSTLACTTDNNRQIGDEFFYENWSSVQLETSINYNREGYENNAFTHNFPEGWVLDLQDTAPEGGCEEYRGWSVVNKDWWLYAGDSGSNSQDRTSFQANSCQNVMVGDGDNLNCAVGYLLNNSLIYTPKIDISSATANDLFLVIQQSWRPYDLAEGNIEVSYDDGDWQYILQQHSEKNDLYRDYVQDETLIINIANPVGAQSVQFRFNYYDTDNGWWWAIGQIGLFSYPCQNGFKLDQNSSEQCVVSDVQTVVQEDEDDDNEVDEGQAVDGEVQGDVDGEVQEEPQQENDGEQGNVEETDDDAEVDEGQADGELVEEEEEQEDCIFVASECNFEGNIQFICDEEPILEDEVKSIYIPEGKQLTLWDSTHFNGKTAVFKESVECLDYVEYGSNAEEFLQIGISFLNKDKKLKNNNLRNKMTKATSSKLE